jgi:hypothetical protein
VHGTQLDLTGGTHGPSSKAAEKLQGAALGVPLGPPLHLTREQGVGVGAWARGWAGERGTRGSHVRGRCAAQLKSSTHQGPTQHPCHGKQVGGLIQLPHVVCVWHLDWHGLRQGLPRTRAPKPTHPGGVTHTHSHTPLHVMERTVGGGRFTTPSTSQTNTWGAPISESATSMLSMVIRPSQNPRSCHASTTCKT